MFFYPQCIPHTQTHTHTFFFQASQHPSAPHSDARLWREKAKKKKNLKKRAALLVAPIQTGMSDTDEWLVGVSSRAARTFLRLECNEHHERPLPPPARRVPELFIGARPGTGGNGRSRRLTSGRTFMSLPPQRFSSWILMRF